VLLWLAVLIAALLVFAAVHDIVAKRRGTYRTAKEWQEITSRRKQVKKDVLRRHGHRNGRRAKETEQR
jgi:hypothetical protein